MHRKGRPDFLLRSVRELRVILVASPINIAMRKTNKNNNNILICLEGIDLAQLVKFFSRL